MLAMVLTGILSFIAVLAIGYLTPKQWGDRPLTDCHYKVCVVRYAIHTNLVVPVQNDAFDWRSYFVLDLTQAQYLSFGFGEQTWYRNPPTQWPEILRQGLRIALSSNPAVISVQSHEQFPTDSEIKCVGVERSHYLALMQFIETSFRLSPTGNKILINSNPSSQTAYYEARDRYSLLRNSNDWTARGLETAHVNTPMWSGLATAVMHHLKGHC